MLDLLYLTWRMPAGMSLSASTSGFLMEQVGGDIFQFTVILIYNTSISHQEYSIKTYKCHDPVDVPARFRGIMSWRLADASPSLNQFPQDHDTIFSDVLVHLQKKHLSPTKSKTWFEMEWESWTTSLCLFLESLTWTRLKVCYAIFSWLTLGNVGELDGLRLLRHRSGFPLPPSQAPDCQGNHAFPLVSWEESCLYPFFTLYFVTICVQAFS